MGHKAANRQEYTGLPLGPIEDLAGAQVQAVRDATGTDIQIRGISRWLQQATKQKESVKQQKVNKE